MLSTHSLKLLGLISSLVLSTLVLSSCGSSRITLEGYDDALLSGKRIFLLIPEDGDYVFSDAAAFGYSRGIAAVTVQSRVDNEFQTRLRDRLDLRLDSNLVVNYRTQPVGAIHPLKAVRDFTGLPSTWDWTKLQAAAKEGAIDYLIVLRSVTLKNFPPKDGRSMGKEEVEADFLLIDLSKKSVMTQNTVSISVNDPRQIADTYIELSKDLTSKMPFHIKEN